MVGCCGGHWSRDPSLEHVVAKHFGFLPTNILALELSFFGFLFPLQREQVIMISLGKFSSLGTLGYAPSTIFSKLLYRII